MPLPRLCLGGSHVKPIFVRIGNEEAADAVFDAPFLTVPQFLHRIIMRAKSGRSSIEGLVAVRPKIRLRRHAEIDDDTRSIAPPQYDYIGELIGTIQYTGRNGW